VSNIEERKSKKQGRQLKKKMDERCELKAHFAAGMKAVSKRKKKRNTGRRMRSERNQGGGGGREKCSHA